MKDRYGRQFLIALIPAGLVLLLIAIIASQGAVRISFVTRDLASIVQVHPLTGALSYLSVLLWFSAAVVCAFSAAAVRGREPADAYPFLAASAALSGYLAFDDLFQIHEDLALRYFGLDEKIVFAAMGVAVFAYFFYFRSTMKRTGHVVLLASIVLMAISLYIDVALEKSLWPLGEWRYLLEDGFKFLGLALWCSYYARTAFHLMLEALEGQPAQS